MSGGRLWLLIVAMGAVTYALRASFPLLQERLHRPAWLERSLRYAPAAVLAAIVAPAVLRPGGEAGELGNVVVRALAALLAALVAWRSRSILYTIAVGMGALWAFGWLAGLFGRS